MHTLLKRGLALLFPSTCTACRSDLAYDDRSLLCGECWLKIEPGPHFMLDEDGRFELTAAGLFRGPLRDVMHAFKYNGRDYLARPLAQWAVPAWNMIDFEPWDPLESTCRHASLSIL